MSSGRSCGLPVRAARCRPDTEGSARDHRVRKSYLDPVERDQYLRESVEIMRQARGWAGCWDFTLTADPLEPDRINVYEHWDSDEAFLRFRNEATAPAQTAGDPLPLPRAASPAVSGPGPGPRRSRGRLQWRRHAHRERRHYLRQAIPRPLQSVSREAAACTRASAK